ncbi:hypothetical protein LOZ12_002917 [Ophidiomyces ophidiicola]|uniref:Uncharacterized protein n=1 Tax=Ophidiomyces ophidiicola TaxID=1387563 RepID=A0ACB8UYK1_9EURO|nr:hypothetical protein LOZ64_003123 [Ophidiomyces ophidiicola]KAI1953289.1 hypothetical protein LOZ62_001130 [Ophidiomyces ophidiicola]KAI2006404.1 hypothetical protein LOZ50_003129 [Ophidiomyces ophidiicola]KAI2033439.1 hypothetical protein LOZ45_000723 [Ophidiomyces ophidiicola]KAI2039324.1 hypothetical protein LOZ47_002376 [Ophidiomyces ophidiicola]
MDTILQQIPMATVTETYQPMDTDLDTDPEDSVVPTPSESSDSDTMVQLFIPLINSSSSSERSDYSFFPNIPTEDGNNARYKNPICTHVANRPHTHGRMDVKHSWKIGVVGKAKGMGLISAMTMHRGHYILCEKVMVVEETLESMGNSIKDYNKLLADQLKEVRYPDFIHLFFNLPKDSEEDKGKFGAYFDKNCIPCPTCDNPYARALGPKLHYLNHSCSPNAQPTLIERTANGVKEYYVIVRASRKIGHGEEITIAYTDNYLPPAWRKEKMKQIFGFECACKCCMYPDPYLEKSFAFIGKRILITASLEIMQQKPALSFKIAYAIWAKFIQNELTDSRCAGLMWNCAEKAVYHSDAGRAMIFLTIGKSNLLKLQGRYGPDMRRLCHAESNLESMIAQSPSKRGLSTREDGELIDFDGRGWKILFMLDVPDDDYLTLSSLRNQQVKDPAVGHFEKTGQEKQPEEESKDDLSEFLEALSLEKKKYDEIRLQKGKDNGKKHKKKRKNRKVK